MRYLSAASARLVATIRRKRSLWTVAVLSAVFVLGTAGTAHASIWQLQDNLDVNPGATWSFSSVGGGTGGFSTVSGDTYAYTTITGAGWSAVGRNVRLSPRQIHTTSCAAQIYLRSSVNGTTATVNIEVIDPSTWNYVALRQVTVTGTGFQAFTLGPWANGPVDVVFRVALIGTTTYRYIGVDDLTVQCSY